MNRPSAPPDPAKVLDAALDVFVYAPIGLLLDAREVVPKLAERGKGQVALARLFGRYALSRGQAEAERLIRANRPAPAAAPVAPQPAPAAAPTPTAPAQKTTTPATTTAARKSPAKKTPVKKATAKKTPTKKAAAKKAPVRPGTLAIPGYDTLSASQVVPRLDALRPAELEAVRAYEAAHRGRRTILNRIAQLQA